MPAMRNYLVRTESPLWLSFVRQNAAHLNWVEISKMENLSDAFVAEFWKYLIHALIAKEMDF